MSEIVLRLPVYGQTPEDDLEKLVPAEAWALAEADTQRAMPAVAKDAALMANIEHTVRQITSQHRIVCGDARDLSTIPDESVHLVVTSPPYWTLKEYLPNEGQLGHVADYEEFLTHLDRVWQHALRVLVPGGRLVVVVGDVCIPRRLLGRHVVFPLHASIQEHCRHIGFDNLSPIIWHKITNATFEAGGGSILGKPYEPGAIIKNDIEYILFQRKPGGYRQQTVAARLLSLIPEASHREWFQQIWTLPGASTRHHPAPYPLPLAERLVRMFSFVGDTVLDPFMGTATTNLAASRWGRNSIGFEIEPAYFDMALARLEAEKQPRMYLREGK
jgi:DNA modification methylase